MRPFTFGLLLVLLSISSIHLLSQATAADDVECFFSPPDDAYNGTNEAFVGEEGLNFVVTWRVNILNWSYELSDYSLFEYEIYERNGGEKIPGSRSTAYVHLDPEASPGRYEIKILMNYTTSDGEEHNEEFPYVIDYIEVIEITNIVIPSGQTRTFRIDLQTHIEFSEISIRYDSDGDVKIDDDREVIKDVSPGTYTFRTTIGKGKTYPGDQQEVAYHIIAKQGDRRIELYEYNINVSITWSDETYFEQNKILIYVLILVGIIVAILLAFSYYFYLKRKRD